MTRHDIETAVRDALAAVTGTDISAISADLDLGAALGLDSLGRLELLAEVEERFDLLFLDANTESATTIDGMVDTVLQELNRAREVA